MTALAYMAAGGHGCISVVANVAPKPCAELMAAVAKGDYAAALKIQDRLTPLHDAIFLEPGLAGYGRLPAHGILGVEMEAAALYTLAARFERQAVAICTMTDCLITHESLSAEDRQSSLREMIELSLDVALGA